MSRAKEILASAINVNGERFTGFKQNLSSDSQLDVASIYAINRALEAIILTGANPGEIYNVKSYGAVADVVVPGSGATVTGTNNTTAFNNCIAAAPSNATVFVPSGNYLVSTALTAITTKRLNIIGLGNIYTNGADFMTFSQPGGVDRQHTVLWLGSVIGRVNIPTHSRTTVLAGTGPNYNTFTGTAFKITQNVNSMHIKVNLVEGFFKAAEIIGGGGGGSQENTIAAQKFNQNAIGISLRSTDGVGWCDKNIFTGFDGGNLRISGGIALKIDGFSSPASTNGEIYNGAFRSNEFSFLAESVDQVVIANGDITEPKFDITIEAGDNSGVFGPQMAVPIAGIQCRIVSPNYVRGPKWEGQGILNTLWLTSGMGIDGTINMPIWYNNTNYIGNVARTDSAGIITVEVRKSLSQTIRAALPANFRTSNIATDVKNTVSTGNVASYNVQTDDYLILCNHTSGTIVINLPTASSNVGRELITRNRSASQGVSFSNGDPDATNTIAAGQGAIHWRADTTAWRILSKWHD